jgi:hypothetical protein
MGTATQLTDFSDLYTETALEGSTALAGSGTAWDTLNSHAVKNMRAGGKFTVSGRLDVFEIDSVTDDTNAVLTSAFSGPRTSASITAFANAGGGNVTVTSASHGLTNTQKISIDGTTSYNGAFVVANATTDTFTIIDTFVADDATGTWTSNSVVASDYVYFEDEYVLDSAFLRPIDQQNFSDSIPIELISRTDFRRQFPTNGVPGHPKVGTIVDKTFGSNTTPVRKIRLQPPPEEAINIPYSFVTSNLAVSASGTEQTQLTSDDDEPIVPLRYRHAIVFHALYHWYRDKKNDQRSQEAKAEYEQVLARIANDTEIGGRHASIRVRRDRYVRRAKRPWGGGTARYDIDGKFDRMEI